MRKVVDLTKIRRFCSPYVDRILVCVATLLFTSACLANPVLNNVTSGHVSVNQTPNSTVVNQSSQKAILNWRSFNIGKNESTHFQQPTGGVALNRISPTDGASQIYGRLTATGQIILVNPAGVYFGPSAYVNVGGLIATTADITDQNFLNGNYRFTQISPYANASVTNEGQIIAAQHGLVALLAPNVINNGLIQADVGHIVLASGSAYTIQFAGNDLIGFSVDPKAISGAITNTGTLRADGGSVLISANAAQNVLDNVINLKGIIQVRSVAQKNGEVILSSDPDAGVVTVAANIDASGYGAGQKGGKVSITGHNILIDSGTKIDVSGDTGGGSIFIGGNYQGKGPLPNANAVVVAPNTNLLANAVTRGNGGTIILWSDNVTKAYGNMSARGGTLGGNGGFIETSGHNFLDISGTKIDTSAPAGKMGTWLLDPFNVTITSSATSGGTFSGGNPNTFNPTANDANVLNTDIQNNLANANVTITTAGAGGQAGTLTVSAPIFWSSTNTLEFIANSTISILADILGLNGTLKITGLVNSVSGNIKVANFELTSGSTWSQIGALPAFNITNHFILDAGSIFIHAVSGDGSVGTPYQLIDVFGLQGMNTQLTSSFELASNIDATVTRNWNSGLGFEPIGNISANFNGNFDGQGFAISNLYINRPSLDGVGLFGYAGGGTLQNVGIINANITGLHHVGGLAGWEGSGAVKKSYSTGTVTASASGSISVGGLVGYNDSPISDSYSGATVSNTSGFYTGGLVGWTDASITDSYAYGRVTGNDTVGGLVGHINLGSVNTSYSTGAVSGTVRVGGLVGNGGVANTNVINSFWDTTTSNQSGSSGSLGTAGYMGMTTAQMLSAANFQSGSAFINGPTGWTITNVVSTGTSPTASSGWLLFEGETRPILRAEWSDTQVNTGHQLQLMGMALDGNYTFIHNIDASGSSNTADIWAARTFNPIGSITNNFTGTLNGQGYVVTGLLINRPSQSQVGLFGTTGDSFITNVGVNGTVTGGGIDVGGLIGRSSSTITNSFFNGTVTGTFTGAPGTPQNTGGLVGISGVNLVGSISNSYSSGSVNGSRLVGGLVGNNSTSAAGITNSYSTSNVSGFFSVGGLVGSNNFGTINKSYASGSVSGSIDVGGLVGGTNNGTIINSFWDTATTHQSTGVGNSSGAPTISVTGGCFAGGACAFGGTANLSVQDTYTAKGWNFSTDWFTPNYGTTSASSTRPMLRAELFSNNITTAHQLALIPINVNGDYTIGSNIDMSGTTADSEVFGGSSGFLPIGTLTNPFTGSITGNYNLIQNLTINRAMDNVGLLGYTTGATINSVYLLNPNITGNNFIGALIGQTATTNVRNSGVAGAIIAATDTSTNGNSMGGLIGSFGSDDPATGVAGGVLANSFSINGSVSGGSVLGGFVGRNVGNIFTSFATGSVTSSGSSKLFVGGFVGLNNQKIFSGSPFGTIADSYAMVNVNGGSAGSVGGFVGTNNNTPTITRSFSVGNVINGAGFLGDNNSGSITNSFWDTQTSGTASSVAGTGQTTAQMFQQATYTGFDFTNTWGIISGQSYPYLRDIFPLTPRVISGASNLGSNASVTLAANGANMSNSSNILIQTTAPTFNNGFYYFLQPNGSISDSSNLLAYTPSGTSANSVTIAPTSGGSITGFNLASGTVSVGDDNVNTISNSTLASALGGLSLTPGILFSVTGSDVTLNSGVHFTTTNAATTYNLDGNISASNGGNITFNGPLVVAAPSAILTTTSSGDIVIANTVTGANSLTVDTAGTASSISGVISGLTALVKAGSGTLTISNNNSSYAGTTTVNAGILSVQNNNALGTGLTIVNNGGTLQIGKIGNSINVGNAITLNGNGSSNQGALVGLDNATASGAITLASSASIGTLSNTDVLLLGNTIDGVTSGGQALTLKGTGTITIGNAIGGATALASINSTSTLNLNGGSIITTGSQTYSNPITLGALLTINSSSNNGAVTFSSTVNGAQSLSINSGSGTVKFDGAIGLINAPTALASTGSGTVQFGAAVGDITHRLGSVAITGPSNLNGGSVFTSGNQSYTGTITLGDNTVLNTGNGAGNTLDLQAIVGGGFNLALNNAGTTTLGGIINNISALTTDALGATTIGADINTTGTQTYNDALTLSTTVALTGSDVIAAAINGGGNNLTISNTGNTSAINGILSSVNAFTKAGTGTLTLNSVNTYNGSTNITGGTLANGIDNALPTTTSLANDGTFDLNGFSQQVANVTGNGVVTNSSGTAGTFTINNSGADSFAGSLTGNLALIKSAGGLLTLTGANNYTGTTTINGGTIANGIDNALPTGTSLINNATFDLNGFAQQVSNVTGTGDVTNSNATASTFTINNSGADSFAGTLSGNLALTKSGAGTLTLSNANTYTGITNVNAGILSITDPQALGAISAATFINTNGTVDINNIVGVNEPFVLNGGTLSGTGTASSNGAITLATNSNSFINANSGTFTINGDINGATNGSGQVTFGGAGAVVMNGSIGNTTPIDTVSSDANTSITGSTTTTGDQLYNNPITLGADTTFSSTTGNITFANAISGAFNLTVATGGTATFNNLVGGGTALNNLDVTANNILINTGSMTTTGSQSFTGALSFGTNTEFTYSGLLLMNGPIALNNFNVSAAGQGAGNTIRINSGVTQTWGIDNVDRGTVNLAAQTGSIGYINVQNLIGGVNNDNFVMTDGGQVTDNINGSGGFNQLFINNSNPQNTWTVTAHNAGNVTGVVNGFTNVQSFTGGLSDDEFFLTGGSIDGGINGNGGNNTIVASNATNNTWTISGQNAGTVNGVGLGGFSNIQNGIGGTIDDTFLLSGGSLTGFVNGSTGNNTIVANNGDNTWSITGTDAGFVTGIGGGFSNIGNLTGGTTGNNNYLFADNSKITGLITGGDVSNGINTLDFSAYLTPITIVLTENIHTGNTSGTQGMINAFRSINNLVSTLSNNNVLQLPNKQNKIVITGPGQGSINDPTNFTGFVNFISTSHNDIVSLPNGATVNSNAGIVTLDSTTMNFKDFGPNAFTGGTDASSVSAIVQQSTNPGGGSNSPSYSMTTVSQNIDDLVKQVSEQFANDLSNVKINPYCYAAN